MAKTKHSYLKTHRLAGRLMAFDTNDEEAKLRKLAADAASGRAAKTLVKEGHLRVTLVVLRKGAVLGAHRVKGDVTLQVLRGRFEVNTAGESVRATRGDVVTIRADVSHDARALSDSTVLITASMR
jgi:quercetin dioxygenase-like cupin family protein